MGITSLELSGPQPSVSTTGQNTSIVEDWICIMDGQTLPSAVLALLRDGGGSSSGFPSIIDGTPNAGDATALAVNLAVKRLDNNGDQSKFMASVTFTNNSTTLNDSNDPIDAQPQISADFVDRIVLVERDTVTGEQIINAAGTQIIVEENDPIQVVTITRNENDFSLSTAKSHAGKLNESAVVILGETFEEKTCLLRRWSGVNEYDASGNIYWRVTYEILISDEPLTKFFLQKGSVDLNGNPFGGVSGVSSNKEWKLDADGIFLSLEDQSDPEIFNETDDYTTIKVSNWGPAVRLQAFPASSIIVLSGGN